MKCLSYLEDRLELNERSQLLTKSLQDNPLDSDLPEIIQKPSALSSKHNTMQHAYIYGNVQ